MITKNRIRWQDQVDWTTTLHNSWIGGKNEAENEALCYLYNLQNNIEDDLELDLKVGEYGYKSYKDSYNAIKNYTYKILLKTIKKIEKGIKYQNKIGKTTLVKGCDIMVRREKGYMYYIDKEGNICKAKLPKSFYELNKK